MPTWAEIRQCTGTMLRSTGIGFFVGLLARVRTRGDDLHRVRRRKAGLENPGAVRKGAIEGVAAPEEANNATSSAGFVPLFAFGSRPAPRSPC